MRAFRKTFAMPAAAVIVALAASVAWISPAAADPSPSTHPRPSSGAAGVTRLCGPDLAYGCTQGGYAGQSVGWAGSMYGAGQASLNQYGYHNCTLYAAYRLMTQGIAAPAWHGNAYQWDDMAWSHSVRVDQIPVVGSIAQWNGGSLGHVGYVEAVTSSYIEVTDDTYGSNYTDRWRIARTSPSMPDNFIHFPTTAYRIGVVANGTAFAKAGGLSTGWVTEYGGVKQLLMTPTRVGVLTASGTLFVKEGGLSASWVREYDGASSFDLSGTRIGVVTTGGVALVKEGGLSAPWVTEFGSHVTQVVVTSTRVGVVNDGTAMVKEGGLSAPWVAEFAGAARLSLAGDRIGVRTTSGAAVVKEGGLSTAWTTEYTGVRQLALSSNRIGVVTSDGRALVKEGGLSAGWVTEYAGAISVMLSGDRIGVVNTGNEALVKEGGLSTGWTIEHAGVSALTLSNLG